MNLRLKMLVKYDGHQQEHDTALTLENCIQMSEGGVKVDLAVDLAYVRRLRISPIMKIPGHF